METEIESDPIDVEIDGPTVSESTGGSTSAAGTDPLAATAEQVTFAQVVDGKDGMDDDDGEIVDDSDDDSSAHSLQRHGNAEEVDSFRQEAAPTPPLARKMNALEKLKSMKFGAGKNPFSMPVSHMEDRRRMSPPPAIAVVYEQKSSKRRNMNDWDQPPQTGRSIHAETGRRIELQPERPYQQYDRRSQSPSSNPRDRSRRPQQHQYRDKHRGQRDRFERRRSSVSPPPLGLNIEQKILSLAGSAGSDEGASRSEALLSYSNDEITRLSAADLKRLVFTLQSIEREHSRLQSLRATQLNELRDLYLKETNEVSVMKTEDDMDNRQKNGGVIPSLFGMPHGGPNKPPSGPPGMPPPFMGTGPPSGPPPFYNPPRSTAPPPPFAPPPFTSVPSSLHMPPPVQHAPSAIYSIPPPSISTTPSTSTSVQPPPFMFSGPPRSSAPPPRGPMPPQPPTSSMSSRGSNGLAFPCAPSMLAPPRFDYDYEQQRRQQQQSHQQPPRYNAPTTATHHSPARSTGSGAMGGGAVGGNAGPRWQPQQQRNINNGAPRMPPFKRGRFETTRKDRRSPTAREISEIVAIIPDEHDRERDKSSDIVVVIPDDDDEFDSLEAESRKETDSHQ